MDTRTPLEAQLSRTLRMVALIQFILYLLGIVGAYFGQTSSFFTQPPLVSNAVACQGLLALLAWFAAGDVRRFRRMIDLLIIGYGLNVLGGLILVFGAKGKPQAGVLWLEIALSAIAGGFILWQRWRTPAEKPDWMPWMPDKSTTDWEHRGIIVCIVVGFGSLVAVVAHFILSYAGPPGIVAFIGQPLMIVGSAAKIGLLGLCLLLAARDIRGDGDLINVFIVGNSMSLLVVIVTHLGINHFGVIDYPQIGATNRSLMLGAMLVDVIAISGCIFLKVKIDKSVLDYGSFFAPLHFRALEAVAETLIDGDKLEIGEPYEMVLRTDDYLNSFPSKRLWLAKASVIGIALTPLSLGLPPINYLTRSARRDFIDRNFKRDIVEKRGIYAVLDKLWKPGAFVINMIEAMMRFNMQLTYLGYYSRPEVQASIGYTPFSQREEGQNVTPTRPYAPLKVITPEMLREQRIDKLKADVVIIGSGAAGATLAEQLVKLGREVLILEKGPYVPPDEFTEDEVHMISRLYADGALQISQALRFTVLQGSCVGGTTVVNNAVCFDTPEDVLTNWIDNPDLKAGIDEPAFRKAQKDVRERMGIQSIKSSSKDRLWEQVLNPGDRVITQGVENYGKKIGETMDYDVVDANIANCLGCGYCNIGCKYGRKLSMLDEVLPKIQRDYPDQLRIVSEAEVVRLNGQGGHVSQIVAKTRDGRQFTVESPNMVVVSAGTIASSWLLMQSGIGKNELPIGHYLCFNMGSPLHGLWDEELNSYAGLQIAHFLRPSGRPGFVYETWYNPPVAQALSMPGWLDTHFQNMLNYNKMAAVGVLVGTEARVESQLKSALFLPGQPDIDFDPSQNDMDKLVNALVMLGKIMFEGGAKTIFASTRHYRSYESGKGVYHAENADDFETDLRQLVKGEQDILLGTGHPQGGNRISATRGSGGTKGGVIDPNFKVYGFDNLYVCDASVFPGALTVNPQLTVMTMAHYAAQVNEAQWKK